MEQLDLVYKTFSTLDESYARSKKTRTEFITEKFGGDIEIGSAIILDVLSEGELTSQGDIEKLTFVKDIFEKIKSNASALDSLKNFAFEDHAMFNQLCQEIDNAMAESGMAHPVTQSHMFRETKDLHIHTDMHGCQYVPVDDCVFCHLSENMLGLMQQAYPMDKKMRAGDYVRLYDGMVRIVSRRTVAKTLKEM